MVPLTLLHSERPKLFGVLVVLSAIGLMCTAKTNQTLLQANQSPLLLRAIAHSMAQLSMRPSHCNLPPDELIS